MHLFVTFKCVSTVPLREKGLGWPTKDICGMPLLGEGLQLVVTPAILSVAVPGMLHHLQDKNKGRLAITAGIESITRGKCDF